MRVFVPSEYDVVMSTRVESQPRRAKCNHCGAPLSPTHAGLCPHCGRDAGKTFFMEIRDAAKIKDETRVEFRRRYEILLTNARELHRQAHYEAAIVIAHTACETCTELTLKNALIVSKVGHLTDPIDDLLSGYNLAHEKVRNLYVAVSGERIQDEPFWQSFKEHSNRRNKIVHQGR